MRGGVNCVLFITTMHRWSYSEREKLLKRYRRFLNIRCVCQKINHKSCKIGHVDVCLGAIA